MVTRWAPAVEANIPRPTQSKVRTIVCRVEVPIQYMIVLIPVDVKVSDVLLLWVGRGAQSPSQRVLKRVV
jgi:hypothetical protein